MSSFFLNPYFFCNSSFFGTLFVPKKSEFHIFWTSYSFWTNVFSGAVIETEKYEFLLLMFFNPCFFLALCLAPQSMSSFFLEPILSLKLCLNRKSMSSFILFWSSYCFLALILFLAQCLTRKSMSSFFVGTLFGTLFGPKSMSSFFWNYFFLRTRFFGTMFGPKKYEFFLNFFFCGVHTFLARCWPEKVWVPFFSELTFFWAHTFLALCFWVPFFLEPILFLRRCLAWKSMSCPFPELFGFFGAAMSLMNKMFGFLRDPFFPGLTLNTFVFADKYLCCWLVACFLFGALNFRGPALFLFFIFWFLLSSSFSTTLFLEQIFSRINIIDSWLWFCVSEETSDVLHPKPVFFFGTF